MHAGTSMLMCHLKEKCWILKSLKTIRKCIKCQRFKPKKCKTIPGILPKDRVLNACVFEIVGCDSAGPLCLTDDKKPYIVLYTCAVYRAVHLELVTFLMTECFIQSLRYFIVCQGKPSIIYSDNGKIFTGADNPAQY